MRNIRLYTLLAFLLMARCREGSSRTQRVQEEQAEAKIDSSKMDSIREYCMVDFPQKNLY